MELPKRERRGRALPALLALVFSAAFARCAPSTPPADVVFYGKFVTLDRDSPEAEAIGVRDGRIVAAGSRDDLARWVGPETERSELPGVAVPGFAEAHGHARSVGEQLEILDLRGLSKQEILDRVAEAAAAGGSDDWIRGKGWDQGHWTEESFPTSSDLDRVAPDRPVFLSRIDGHSAWLNSRALELGGISAATADPEGGKIFRDQKGNPTGILVDEALDLVRERRPASTPEEREARLRAALDQYVRWGVTSLHDAGVGLEGIETYRQLLEKDALPLRVYVMASGEGATAEEYLEKGPQIDPEGRLTVRCFKVLLDGALGSRGAELSEPYSDLPSETGLVQMKDDEFRRLLERATERGFQVAAHAIGDRAIRRALDGYEAVGPRLRELRPRIEHVSVVNPSDIPRFAALGVIASMQPNFVGEYSRWSLDRVGPGRITWVYPTKTLLDAGAVVASGTDFTASDSGDPVVTLYSLVTRKGADRAPEEGFLPEQKIGVEEALRTMTEGAAFASFQENDLGALTVGRFADMTVLSEDPRSMPPEELRDLRVLATVVGGKVVHRIE
jgi:predicted amidohydrolase YtcJ